jgi:Zn-dependent protease
MDHVQSWAVSRWPSFHCLIYLPTPKDGERQRAARDDRRILCVAVLDALTVPVRLCPPVWVNFRALKNPRRDMICVAAAGPATNFALATAAALTFHLMDCVPVAAQQWAADNPRNALILNVVLAVFDLLPLPPLTGTSVLPAAIPLAPVEQYGMAILICALVILPYWVRK